MTPVIIGNATLYNADCREVLPILTGVDAVITDPPYGMNATTANMSGGYGRWCLDSSKAAWPKGGLDWDKEAPAVVSILPSIADCIIWGGQFFNLPQARGWLVWNKIIRNWSSSECELAWTNIEQPVRAFDYSHGQLATEGKKHPTQKPLPLMKWCINQFKSNPKQILDPFIGSGTTGVAAVQMDRKFIGIELDNKYFDIACRRIEDAQRQQRMF